MTGQQRYYGKYRGMVVSNIDPMQQGRLQVQVSDVLGLNVLNWALPCLPFAGRQMGWWALPQIGAGVWVEFEQGNPDYPIWTGCWSTARNRATGTPRWRTGGRCPPTRGRPSTPR